MDSQTIDIGGVITYSVEGGLSITSDFHCSGGDIGGFDIGGNSLSGKGIKIDKNGQISIDSTKSDYGDGMLIYGSDKYMCLNSNYMYIANRGHPRSEAAWVQYDGIWLFNTGGSKAILMDKRGIGLCLKDESGGYTVDTWYVKFTGM